MPSRREIVRRRASDRCKYCRLAQAHSSLPHEIDHVRARKHRGPTTLQNLCWACAQCNAAKGANAAGFDPHTDQLVPLFNPRADQWDTHFEWNGPVLVGKTPMGRATIHVLGINRPERVEHRRLLMEAGEYFGNSNQ